MKAQAPTRRKFASLLGFLISVSFPFCAPDRCAAENGRIPEIPRPAPWIGERGIVEPNAQLAARDQLPHERVVHRKPRLVAEPIASKYRTPPQARPITAARQGTPETPLFPQTVSSINFTAATTPDCSGFPPDTMGAAGPTQFIIALNGRIRSFSKATGARDGRIDVTTDSFFSSVKTPGLLNSTSDPRIRYDRLSGRWFISMIDVPGNNAASPNRIMLAMSGSGIIQSTSTWTFFQFRHDMVGAVSNVDTGNFADYPTLAIDANAIYIGVNIFSPSNRFLNTTLHVIRKSSVLSGGPIVVTPFRGLISGGTGIFTPHGVDNYDPNATEGYVIGNDRNDLTVLHLLRISTPGATPAISEYLDIPINPYAPAILVPHLGNLKGTNGYLDDVDQRLMAAHYRNGLLWTCHNVGVDNAGNPSNVTRDGVQWFAITNIPTGATPTVSQSGIVFQSTTNNTNTARSYWMGTIMVSGQGHAAMGFTSAGAVDYPNAATCGRLATDPPGVMHAPVLYTRAVASYNPTGDPGSSRGRRWGDYSFTSVDPADDMTMWTIQEYSGVGVYAVQVAKLLAPPPPVPTNCNPGILSQGATNASVLIAAMSATNGAGFFDPGAGFSNRLSMSISGAGITISNLTWVDPLTVSASLTVASNAQAGPRAITFTNPDGQAVVATNGLLTIIPGPINNPPTLGFIPDQKMTVGTTLAFTNSASDPDSPPETLVFSLGSSAPTNAVIDPVSGAFSWTPNTNQLGTNFIAIVVTDNGSPPLSATQSFQVIVFPTNTAPTLAAIPNQTIYQGITLLITNTVTDPDLPPETMTFALTGGAATGATVDSASGLFSWTPALSFANTTNSFTVQVTDNGYPPLSDSKSFAVSVLSRPVIQSVIVSNGVSVITWSAISGQNYRVQFKSDINAPNWNDLTPDVTASGSSAFATDSPQSVARFYRVRVLQ